MRNLKKFLALVLAMMMAMSLMVTASAANEKENGHNQYADKDAISEEFVEAVDVLYKLGVMTGDYGNFKPSDPITRAEMAAILYRVMSGHTGEIEAAKKYLYAETAAGRFDDVTPTAWFAPYIGWCYDAGVMVGSNGKFRPTDNVTGYETVVMMLRAMGYGKNSEYTGRDWFIKASSDATLAHLLDGVRSANYSYALSQNSSREVVASIVFSGLNQPTVNYQLGYYNQYVGVASADPYGGGANVNKLNASLGVKYFGLTSSYAVIVGNQSTGEVVTRINTTGINVAQDGEIIRTSPTSYAYTGGNKLLDWTTDLRLFGHVVKVWYDGMTTDTDGSAVAGPNGTDKRPLKTYAVYDKAYKTDVVKATEGLELSNTTDAGHLGTEVLKAGFGLNGDQTAVWNFAFGRTDATPDDGTYKTGWESPIKLNNQGTDAPYYLVISNNEDEEVDLVISLDLTVTRISQSGGNVWGTEFVSVNNGNGSNYFGQPGDMNTMRDSFNKPKGYRVNILTDSLGTGSTTEQGANVAAVLITGTTGAATGQNGQATGNYPNPDPTNTPYSSTYYHELFKLTTVVEKVVIARDPRTQTVTFNDGTTMARSWLADTVADNRLTDLADLDEDNSLENIKRANAPTAKGTYYFTVVENAEGVQEYVYWSEAKEPDTFIYATYLDYDEPVGSSSFTYPVIGVIGGVGDQRKPIENGTQPEGTANGDNMDKPMDSERYQQSDLPKRDSDGKVGASVRDGMYRGYILDGKTLKPVLAKDNNSQTWKQGDETYFGDHAIEIGSREANVGSVLVGTTNGTGLYMTNNTKIYVVSGTGYDTQKVTVYNGVKEFLDKSTKVTINGHTTTSGNDDLLDSKSFYEMIYWTQAPSNYAQDYTTTAWDISEVYIPYEAIKREGATESSLYFIGDRTPVVWNNTGDPATLFTFYDKNGNAVDLWVSGIAGRPGVGGAGAGQNDAGNTTPAAKIIGAEQGNFFLKLVNSGKKANDEQPIYNIAVVSSTANKDDLGIVGKYLQDLKGSGDQVALSDANDDKTTAGDYTYIATINTQNLASIGDGRDVLWGVGAAKVVNLSPKFDPEHASAPYYPGVTNVTTLNAVSSMGTDSTADNANLGVSVSAFCNKDNGTQLDVIFVNSPDFDDDWYSVTGR